MRPAWLGVQMPAASRVPGLTANDVTIGVSTALAKSTTARHCARLRTDWKPGGGAGGALSVSAKYVVFAQVPLTLRYAGDKAAASFRNLELRRSVGGL